VKGGCEAIGPFTVSVTGARKSVFCNGVPIGPDPAGLTLMCQVIDFLAEGLSHENPLDMVKDFLSAERTFTALIECGYPHRPLLREVSRGLDETARLFRFELVRRLLLGSIPDELAKECLKLLTDHIERGLWPEWRADIDACETELAEAAQCA